MYVWMNEFMCPGFVLFPRNPHPKSNKYHNINFDESGIMCSWYIVDGRDNTVPVGRSEFETITDMNTVELMLLLTR